MSPDWGELQGPLSNPRTLQEGTKLEPALCAYKEDQKQQAQTETRKDHIRLKVNLHVSNGAGSTLGGFQYQIGEGPEQPDSHLTTGPVVRLDDGHPKVPFKRFTLSCPLFICI